MRKYGLMFVLNSIVFWFIVRWSNESVSWDEVVVSLQYVSIPALILVFISGLVLLVFYGYRLSCLLEEKFSSSFWMVTFGFGANNILPFRLGDVLKLYFAKKYFDVNPSRLLFIKVLEKFFDLFLLFVIGALAFLLQSELVYREYLLFLLAIILSLPTLSLVFSRLLRKKIRLFERLRRFTFFDHVFEMFLEVMSNPAKFKALLLTIVIWAATVLMVYFYYTWTLPGVSVGWGHVFALVFITSLSLGLPSSPGALGVFEAAIVLYLTKFLFVPVEKALAIALMLHLISAVPQVLLMITALFLGRKRKISAL